MALTLKTVGPARGAHWVADGLRLLRRRPVALTAPYTVFVGFALLAMVQLPPLAMLIAFSLPLFGLGYMVTSQAVLLEGPVRAAHFLEPLAAPGRRRRDLLILCLLFVALSVASALIGNVIADGGFTALAEAMRKPGGSPTEIDQLMASRSMVGGVLFVSAAVLLIGMVFWHAPALVHWGGQGVAQSLFSSALAVWRCRGAFLVYGLTLTAVVVGAQILIGVGVALLGTGALGSAFAVAVGLAVSALFYVTLIFTFNDSFGSNGAP
ncbi:MAG: BPSS1780 family membrane protein [Rubrivivax sp.]